MKLEGGHGAEAGEAARETWDDRTQQQRVLAGREGGQKEGPHETKRAMHGSPVWETKLAASRGGKQLWCSGKARSFELLREVREH